MIERGSKVLWIVAATLCVVVVPVARGQKMPCYFVFGDDLFDNGNNNALNTTAKVNYFPYGIDFPQGPTGRFSNGRNIPDIIAELADFSAVIPPFAGASREQAFIGLNYASGGGGIMDETGQNLGERFSLKDQINNHISAMRNAMVDEDQRLQCLYIFSFGTNDYLNNYFLRPPNTTDLDTPPLFATFLIQQYHLYILQMFYFTGARKVALFGIGKIGCTPAMIASRGGGVGCAEEVNEAVKIFNDKLKELAGSLNILRDKSKFTYVDLYSGNAQDFATRGVTVNDTSCCMVEPDGELCAENEPVLADRTKYMFWDNVHTTEMVNEVVANLSFEGDISWPYSIAQLLYKFGG